MAGSKMPRLFIVSLVICFALLPLVAARIVPTQTLKDAKLGSSREISAEFVLEPPRGRAVFQVAPKDDKQMSDKEAQDIIKKILENPFGLNYTKNCSETDAAKQAIGAIFGKMIQRDLEFAQAISDMVEKALAEEAIAEMFECMMQEMLKKKQQQEEEKEAFEALLKEMFKHKPGGHYDKDFCKGMRDILKDIFLKTPPLDSKLVTDMLPNMSSGEYETCTRPRH